MKSSRSQRQPIAPASDPHIRQLEVCAVVSRDGLILSARQQFEVALVISQTRTDLHEYLEISPLGRSTGFAVMIGSEYQIAGGQQDSLDIFILLDLYSRRFHDQAVMLAGF